MSRQLVPEARATLALAAARGMSERDVAESMGMDPSTLNRKKADPERWNRATTLAAFRVLGTGIPDLIADLEAFAATRDTDHYREGDQADAVLTGQVA